MYNYVLLKMSTWYSKHVEESNNIWRINNIRCITLVFLYGQFMLYGQRNIKKNVCLYCWSDWRGSVAVLEWVLWVVNGLWVWVSGWGKWKTARYMCCRANVGSGCMFEAQFRQCNWYAFTAWWPCERFGVWTVSVVKWLFWGRLGAILWELQVSHGGHVRGLVCEQCL